MRILAIDPGSMLGWATDSSGRLEWGMEDFHIKGGESSGNRWMRYSRWVDEMCIRLDHGDQCSRVDLIVYEQLTYSPQFRKHADLLKCFTSRLEEFAEDHGFALQPVPGPTLKAFAIPKVKRKKGDPKMDRSKAAMIAAAEYRLVRDHGARVGSTGDGITAPVQAHYADKSLSEHEADALWLYWWAKENCCHPVVPPSPAE